MAVISDPGASFFCSPRSTRACQTEGFRFFFFDCVITTMASHSTDINEITTRKDSLTTHIPALQASEFGLTIDQPETLSLASTLRLPDDSTSSLLSTQSVSSNKPLHNSSLKDLLVSIGGLESLGPDAVDAEITIAGKRIAQCRFCKLAFNFFLDDESYIETSSGPLARELKRRFDQYAGVGPTVRSPYAITAYGLQAGKSIVRLG